MIRKGMWIDVGGRIAIANRVLFIEVGNTGAKVPTEVEAHFVRDDGTTFLVMNLPYADCKQAALNRIPDARVAATPSKKLELFNYK